MIDFEPYKQKAMQLNFEVIEVGEENKEYYMVVKHPRVPKEQVVVWGSEFDGLDAPEFIGRLLKILLRSYSH